MLTYDVGISPVLDSKTLVADGGYSKRRYWVHGTHPELAYGHNAIRYINGLSGLETEVTVTSIAPSGTFEVRS